MILRRSKTIPSFRPRIGQRSQALSVPRSVHALIKKVRDEAEQAKLLSGVQLKAAYGQLRAKIEAGQSLTETKIVCRCFGLATEALRRATGMIYYDVQLMGGFALAAGTIAEIQTGEGKTITTGLPAILHALSGRGVHVSTTNDYLSNRDHEELAPVFGQLGLTSSVLEPQGPLPGKIAAYACDITYGPGYEFGFDFLKDQIAIRGRYKEPLGGEFIRSLRGIGINHTPLAQRGHAFAIVDEADSVLIDEATTPLVMSGGNLGIATAPELFHYANDIAQTLNDHDYETDLEKRAVWLTESGWKSIHRAFSKRPTGRLARKWSTLIENALRAEHLLQCDVDYVVREGKVMIVDPNTGRIHDERTWSSGLHQAVEVKEGVQLTKENETQARITRQRYGGFYDGMCGLTGTASGSEAELFEFYGLPVVRIPTHKPCRRNAMPTRCFVDTDSKLQAIVKDTRKRQQSDRAILIGTRTILETKRISSLLDEAAVDHVVLNGLQDEEESEIIGRAGAVRAVTVATNMAGRGTDIRLAKEVKASGGLHVLATEFHHSQRVDRQLAGRAARQGDPGSCQFFASADDAIIAEHAPALAASMRRCGDATGECKRNFHSAIKSVQAAVERKSLLSRQNMVTHDNWLESVQSTLARRA